MGLYFKYNGFRRCLANQIGALLNYKMVYTGIDIVEIVRVQRLLERYAERFTKRVFTAREIAEANEQAEKFASRFAAKEAVKKILTDDWHFLAWHSIETTRQIGHAPQIQLYADAAQRAKALGIQSISVSLTHSAGVAIASVVAST